jgi:hypothetical protein
MKAKFNDKYDIFIKLKQLNIYKKLKKLKHLVESNNKNKSKLNKKT